jgi:hypothetical protein
MHALPCRALLLSCSTVAGAAKALSADLYTKPTHFVLELLQNADDCRYAAGVQPKVLLVVMPDAILHATNEIGFKAAEVEAICALARSTKSRKVGAFTGEKGEPRPPAASCRCRCLSCVA